LAGQHPNL
jgi:hypothetical protein